MPARPVLIRDLPTRFVIALAMSAFMVWVVSTNWNGDVGHVSVSLAHWRLFSTAIVAFACIHFSIWALAPRWQTLGSWPIWTTVVALAVVVGLAIGTTDWQGWTMSRWWQFWWTGAMAMGAVSQISGIVTAQSPKARPPGNRLEEESPAETFPGSRDPEQHPG